MAPPRNDELREKIRSRYREMKSLGTRLRSETLRTEFGLPDWKLQYYLREQGVDRRRRYSKTALKKLSLDDETALAVEAEKQGTTIPNLKRAAERAQSELTAVGLTDRQKISRQGYFDWNKTSEAKALGILPATISNARQTLRVRFGLYLDKPNLLAHRKSGKVCRLLLKEQKLLLSDPAGYIVRHAREIARRWEPVSLEEILRERQGHHGTANK